MHKHERRAAKRLLMGAFVGFLVGVLAYTPGAVFALTGSKQAQQRDTSNLRLYERNLDILSGKSNDLSDLNEELHRWRTFNATGVAPGGAIVNVREISTDDVIVKVTAISSATLVAASTAPVFNTAITVDGTQGAALSFTSNLWGEAGNKVQIHFEQMTDTNAALSINTTGYLIQVRLSSASNNSSVYKSGTQVCAAFNADPDASRLANCTAVGSAVNFSSAAVAVPSPAWMKLAGGTQGSNWGFQHDVTDFFTIESSATIRASANYPGNSVDGLEFTILDKPDN